MVPMPPQPACVRQPLLLCAGENFPFDWQFCTFGKASESCHNFPICKASVIRDLKHLMI